MRSPYVASWLGGFWTIHSVVAEFSIEVLQHHEA